MEEKDICCNLRCKSNLYNKEAIGLCRECQEMLRDHRKQAVQCPTCSRIWSIRDKLISDDHVKKKTCELCKNVIYDRILKENDYSDEIIK